MSTTEAVIWNKAANYTSSSMRAVGGKLVLTNARLLFHPHGFDASTGGKAWGVSLPEIRSVDIAPAQLSHLFAGGMRKRLRVTLADGSQHLFVINKLSTITSDIQRAIAAVDQETVLDESIKGPRGLPLGTVARVASRAVNAMRDDEADVA